MTGPEYTTCVASEDYEDYSGLGIALTGNWWEATDYMLHRKLVCLGSVHPDSGSGGTPSLARSRDPGTSCAIGRIASFEPPSGKSFPENIDNDFSFNIVLRPNDEGRNDPRDPYPPGLSDNPFVDSGWVALSDTARKYAVNEGYQGVLVADTHDVPEPHEFAGGASWTPGYTSAMYFDSSKNRSGTAAAVLTRRFVWFLDESVQNYPLDAPGAYSVPVLHCECEGTRIRDVFNVADQMPGGGSSCKKNWFTSFVCFVLRIAFLPFTTAFVAEAWAKATDGDYHDALVGNGDLHIGDLVVVRGRWVFDAGHQGQNEIHPVSTIQKVPDSVDRPAEPPAGSGRAAFDRFYKDWCGLSSEAPPDHAPGERPPNMTGTQTKIYDAQQRPENRYAFHPDLDGCAPSAAPVIRAVEPSRITRGDRDQDVVVFGGGFVAGAQVAVRGPEIPVKAVVVRSETEIVITVGLTSTTPPGRRTVVVSNPDGRTALCRGCLVINAAPIIH